MSKAAFVAKFKAARVNFKQTLADLTPAEADVVQNQFSIKDKIGLVAAWEREVIIADEMLKRDEDSYLYAIDRAKFEENSVAARHNWSLAQVQAELDLNYEALLMAWDEYEAETGPFGEATWQPHASQSLWWLIEQQTKYGREIADQRGLKVDFE